MGASGRTLQSAVALIVMLGAGALVPTISQQQTPATKVTPLLKEAMAELPGREIIMVTLDIPPGGGSPPHRHPGHVARRFSQCKPDRARQGSRLHRGRERQADHRAGEAVASAVQRPPITASMCYSFGGKHRRRQGARLKAERFRSGTRTCGRPAAGWRCERPN